MKRRLVHFLAIGALLFATRRAFSDEQLAPLPLRVAVERDASPAKVRAAVDEAMLLDLGLRAGWPTTDPFVRDRLVRNMRFAGERGSADALIAAALRLDMARRDPVARRRLVDRARALLIQRVTPEPSAQQLEAHRQAHADRFTRPGQWRVHQVFLSAERRGSSLEDAAAALGRRLAEGPLSPDRAAALSDPMLLGTDLGWVEVRRLGGSLGGEVAEALGDAEAETWIGPTRSAFGLHFFWVEAQRPAALPPLPTIEAEVRADWRRGAEERALRDALGRLRETYAVEVVP